MTLLPDHKIAREMGYGELTVEPVDMEEQLQPASLDIRLGNTFKQFIKGEREIISIDEDMEGEMIETHVPDSGEIVLWPGDFYLADTKEYFEIPDYLLGEVTGRSSIGRLGITVHQTAGIFDPGYKGDGVLELKNVANRPVSLKPGMRIAQITFTELNGSANQPYNSEDNKYQGQEGAVASRIQEDMDDAE